MTNEKKVKQLVAGDRMEGGPVFLKNEKFFQNFWETNTWMGLTSKNESKTNKPL